MPITDVRSRFWQCACVSGIAAQGHFVHMRYERPNEYAPRIPLCPSCAQIMRLARVTSRFGNLPDVYTFECRGCGVTQSRQRTSRRGERDYRPCRFRCNMASTSLWLVHHLDPVPCHDEGHSALPGLMLCCDWHRRPRRCTCSSWGSLMVAPLFYSQARRDKSSLWVPSGLVSRSCRDHVGESSMCIPCYD